MPDWIINNPPLAVIAIIAVASALITFGTWIGSVNTDRANFRDFMKEVRKDIKEILKRLPSHPPELTSSSPLTLTDFGQELAEGVGAKEIAEGLVPRVREDVSGMDPYSVQEYCLTFLTSQYEPPPEINLRINQVAYDRGVKREQVLRVIAIELRDLLI